jgi:hypothetical protein
MWSFIAKKQKHRKDMDPPEYGDCYVFLALAGAGKAIISFRAGKRDTPNTRRFIEDVRARVLGAPEISSDAFRLYPMQIERSFGTDCRYGAVDKDYAVEGPVDAAHRYSPDEVVPAKYTNVIGSPAFIFTCYIERQNLTMRMQ